MPKRCLNIIYTPNKKYRKTNNEWDKFNNIKTGNNWISATKIHNYMMKDTLTDWINLKNNNYKENTMFLHLLFDKGNTFEELIYDKIIQMVGKENVITIYNKKDDLKKFETPTINAIKKNIPIIFQGVIYNNQTKLFGILDIIIRSDFLKLISNNECESDDLHYKIIDIKWTTPKFNKNNNAILNIGHIPAYKGQLAIYNYILGRIQGYFSNQAYILGKNWLVDKKLGVVDYSLDDNKYITQTINAIEWLNNLYANGNKWTLDPPSIKELYPNMKVDSLYNLNEKKQIANKLKDISLLWNVTYKNKNMAFDKNIFSYTDKNCSSGNLGIYGKRGLVLNKIININRTTKNKILPVNIKNNYGNWKLKTKGDYFIDYETINIGLYDDNIENVNNQNITFMIGIGYEYNKIDNILCNEFDIDIKNGWCYLCLMMNKFDHNKEIDLFNKMILFLNKRSTLLNTNIKLFHWCNIEYYLFNKLIRNNTIDITWIDMHKIFIDEPIIVNGAFDFKLKNIVNAMIKHKLINIKCNNIIDNGLNAMVVAINAYKQNNINDLTKIKNYNNLDCMYIWKIVEYLRKK